MRIPILISAVLLSASLAACEGDPLSPAKPGEVSLYVSMEHAPLRIDRRGVHVQPLELRVSIEGVELKGGGATCLKGICQGESKVAQLRPEQYSHLATWVVDEGSSPELSLQVAPIQHSGVFPNASIVVAGNYNGMIMGSDRAPGGFVLGLDHKQILTIKLPRTAEGQRVRLVLDPDYWFYDADAGRVIQLEGIVGRVSDREDPPAQEILQRIKSQLRLELF